MGTVNSSLHWLVDKWLAPTPSMPARVTRFGRMPSNQRRYVRVETRRPEGPLAIYFFLHDDGVWCVFPPADEGPTLKCLTAFGRPVADDHQAFLGAAGFSYA
ncbi:hypothetical protein [Paraburkholderia sp. CI3]|uniref:hypothetical protein n=1 Tax=Paraburkholderia sp. CI3 TaxID=2991060 RepID=UPI003D1A7965